MTVAAVTLSRENNYLLKIRGPALYICVCAVRSAPSAAKSNQEGRQPNR